MLLGYWQVSGIVGYQYNDKEYTHGASFAVRCRWRMPYQNYVGRLEPSFDYIPYSLIDPTDLSLRLDCVQKSLTASNELS